MQPHCSEWHFIRHLPTLKLFAIDAATSEHRWTFDPADSTQQHNDIRFILNNNRGVTWWGHDNDQRILYTAGSFLYGVNASNGKLIDSFGSHGRVDLHDGLGREVQDLYVTATSPGIIYKDLFILGSRVDEGPTAAPGHIRAYDVRTGKLQWIFHTIPQPGEFGYDSWDDPIAYKHIGGANSWGGFSLDEQRGILFAPTGSASFDFYGGKRKGANLFANCLLALDAATGTRKWHFQFIHHDVWDRDLPCAPALVTIKKMAILLMRWRRLRNTAWYIFMNGKQANPFIQSKKKRLIPTLRCFMKRYGPPNLLCQHPSHL
ncbi:hypothetical protein [Paraflavitalea speifideaquila]|uniref:hypothetical protein n=1 Tax=Paraflavitalea speifideaquila TaxID=3076558 RepID=UPI0028F16C53|nr:hypothetical protein [Paraflavitalea speifideiaquila]